MLTDLWDPLLYCNGWEPCHPAGMMTGIVGAASASDQRGGEGIRIHLDPAVDPGYLDQLIDELSRRATALGFDPIELLAGNDHWPSCRGKPDCLTVDESILP